MKLKFVLYVGWLGLPPGVLLQFIILLAHCYDCRNFRFVINPWHFAIKMVSQFVITAHGKLNCRNL